MGLNRPLLLTLAMAFVAAAAPAQNCVPGPETLCLLGIRFAVEVEWQDPSVATGNGQAVPVTDDWGYFWFGDQRYADLAIRLLNGCALNGHYWVEVAGLSDFAQNITVTDTATGIDWTHANPLGTYLPSFIDTAALPTCPKRPGGEQGPPPVTTGAERQPSLPLVDGRFEIEVAWRDPAGGSGLGIGVPLTSHSAYFYFFSASDPSVLVKLVDDTATSRYFAVAYGSFNNLEYTIEVTDLVCNGDSVSYLSPQGEIGGALDPAALFNCHIFSDDLESGDDSAWSITFP